MRAAIDAIERMFAALLPELERVVRRFPLAVAAAIALTVYYLFDLHKLQAWSQEVHERLLPGLLSAFYWSLAVALAGEALQLSRSRVYALSAAGLALLAVGHAFADALELSPHLMLAALTLFPALAAYVRSPADRAAFWLFNHHLWIGCALALVAAALFAAGVTAIIESLRYLFGLDIPNWVHEKVWTLAFCLVAPLSWLSFVPRRFDEAVVEGEQTEFTSRAVAVMVKYILVPLLLVYAAILHAYVIKILIDWGLPRGRVGWMVLSYGGMIALTALFAFPTRESGGGLVRLFWRVWPWLLAIPTILLFIAIGVRIGQYGLTESRYLVLLAGVWMVALAATQGWFGERRDLRLIPAIAAGIALVATLGPWGIMGLPTRTQLGELFGRLEAAGITKDGRLAAGASATLSDNDRRRIAGIVDYLAQRGRLDRLRPIFSGVSADPFAQETADIGQRPRVDYALATRIKERFGVDKLLADTGRGRTTYFTSSQPVVFDLAGGQKVVGYLSLYADRRGTAAIREVKGRDGTIRLEFNGDTLQVHDSASSRTASFDLTEPALLKAGFPPQPVAGGGERAPLRFKSAGALDADLVLTSANGYRDEGGAVVLRNITFWVLLGSGAPGPR
jgi:hypothetical protein